MIKNKIFAFFAMENIVSHGTGAVSFISVPTLAMRSGDFSGLAPIYNPTTQTVDPATGAVTRQPFANNQIPASMFDTVAKNIQSYFPLPNRTGNVANGVTTNNYSYQLPSSSPKRKYFGRFDADVTSNNRITGSASWNDGPSIGVGPVCPLNCTNSDIFNTTNQLSDYWTITPHLINEARIGFMGEYDLITPDTLGQGYPAKLGLGIGKADVFPAITITNIYGLGPGSPSFANYKENNIDISDQVTLIKGRHILHFGGEVLIFRADSTAWGNINSANLGFTGVYTAGSNIGSLASTSGVAYADFLLGYAKSWSASVSPEYGGRLKNPGVFIQDDFKLSPKLTLNMGLRWEGNTGWSEIHGNERGFDPNVINPATNTPGAMWYASSQTNGRTSLQKGVWNNWMPRFGFAYQLGNKTTVRGGFGLYTYPWNVDTYGGGLGSAFSTSGNQTDSTNNAQPVVLLSSDGNTNYQGTKGSAINALYRSAPTTPQAYNGQNVGFVQYTSPVPILKSWNLTVQRQVTSNMVAEIGVYRKPRIAPGIHYRPQSGSGKPARAERCGLPSLSSIPERYRVHDAGHLELPRISGADYPPAEQRAAVQLQLHLVPHAGQSGFLGLGQLAGRHSLPEGLRSDGELRSLRTSTFATCSRGMFLTIFPLAAAGNT